MDSRYEMGSEYEIEENLISIMEDRKIGEVQLLQYMKVPTRLSTRKKLSV